MSDDKQITPAECSRQDLAENFRRYLTFLGVREDEFVELTALGEKVNFTGGSRGDGVIKLASDGGLLRDVHGIYVVPNRLVPAIGGRYEPGTWHRGIDRAKDNLIE